MGERKILVARTAGFCFGVKRAVEKVYEQVSMGKQNIYTYGPIIHNEEVVTDLEKKGVRVLENEQEYPCVGTYMVGKQDKTYYIMSSSQITDDMRTQAATDYANFMKTDAYKTYTKAYDTFIKKNPGYEDKISEKIGS